MIDTRAMFDQLIETIRAEERAKLLAAIDGTGASPQRRGRKRGRPAATRSAPAKGVKRSPEDIEALTKNLLGYVKKNAGSRMEEIARGLNVTTRELMLPMGKLLESKQVKSQGQKRATKYSVR